MATPFWRPVNAAPAVYMSAALLLVLLARITKTRVTATNAAKMAMLSAGLPTLLDLGSERDHSRPSASISSRMRAERGSSTRSAYRTYADVTPNVETN